jgi:23S rRNA (adenine2503-C2)-methyltransferase
MTGMWKSRDGSIKHLMALEDGLSVEAVWIPQDHGANICVSCQVGCPNKCRHCATGTVPFERDLTAGEIFCQVATLVQLHGREQDRIKVLFMGMGEPLLNYTNVVNALKELIAKRLIPSREWAILSTSGISTGIRRLACERERPKLAVTLGAVPDEKRVSLLPHAKMFPLDDLLDACRFFQEKTGEAIIFQVPVVTGINSTVEAIQSIGAVVREFQCEVHLVPFNSFPQCGLVEPSFAVVGNLIKSLGELGINAAAKPSYGRDVNAGCGQLVQTRCLLPPADTVE